MEESSEKNFIEDMADVDAKTQQQQREYGLLLLNL